MSPTSTCATRSRTCSTTSTPSAPAGLAVLVGYLDDTRATLAEHAHSELIAITGTDLGKDEQAWRAWLERRARDGARPLPTPWRAPTDPVAAWGLDILVERTAGA